MSALPFVLRASLVLTSSFVVGEIFTVDGAFTGLTIVFTYTRGADGGNAAFRLEWSPDGSEWIQDTNLSGTITVAQPYGSQPQYVAEIPGPKPADGTALKYVSPPIRVPYGMQFMRPSFAEVGVGGTPGILAARLFGTRGVAA